MRTTDALRAFITDDQILEVLILWQTKQIAACRLLSAYIWDKWNLTGHEAAKIIEKVDFEFNN
jgi:hypothetical protein